jgi:hypothetical protein
VDQLLALGASPFAVAEFGMTPLHLAAAGGHEKIAGALLRAGGAALLACATSRGRTPAHLAVRGDSAGLLRLFLACAAEAGADEGEERAAELARQKKLAAKAEAKAERRSRRRSSVVSGGGGGDGDVGSGGGGSSSGSVGTMDSSANFSFDGTGSVVAAAVGREAGRKAALHFYANTADDQGLGILHEAAARGVPGVVTQLLEAGAEPHARSRGGRRLAAELALEYGHTGVAALINEHAAGLGKAPDWAAGFLRGLHDRQATGGAEAHWSFLE